MNKKSHDDFTAAMDKAQELMNGGISFWDSVITGLDESGTADRWKREKEEQKAHRKIRRYTQEEIQFIKDNLPERSYAEMTDLFNRNFDLQITLTQMGNIILHNKLRNGRVKNIRLPIGSERIDSRGYAHVKTADPDVWKLKHHKIWEEAHGPIPKGHAIMFANGDKSDFNLDNLLMVSRKERGFMNHEGLIFSDKDLTKTGKAIADLTFIIADRERKLGLRRIRKKKESASSPSRGIERNNGGPPGIPKEEA